MVDYHYIKRGNKIYGPYYYRSYRVGKKVKKEYLGKNYPTKIRTKKRIRSMLFFFVLLILMASALYLIPYFANITSKATAEPGSTTLENNESSQLSAENLTMEIIDSITSSTSQTNLSELANITLNETVTEENESNISEINTTYPLVEQPKVNISNATNTTEQPTETNRTGITETLVQHKAIIGKPVRWTKRVILESPSNVTVELPKEANNITVKKIANDTSELVLTSSVSITGQVTSSINLTGKKKELTYFDLIKYLLRKLRAKITGHAISETPETGEMNNTVEIKENVIEVEVEYYTEAPTATEKLISQGKKEITITGPDSVHYTDILAYTYLSAEAKNSNSIILYWLNGTEKQKTEFDAYDTDNNSRLDYVEWLVPSLSNQTYEVSIAVINIQSYPSLGGNWTVFVNTTGEADLTITAINGTTWNYQNDSCGAETCELRFENLTCGNILLIPEWQENSGNGSNNSVFYSNYSCSETGAETNTVLRAAKHTLKFEFGSDVAYAFNEVSTNASKTNLTIWDDSDSKTVYANYSRFYANYTNATSGNSVNATNVFCTFRHNKTGLWSTPVNMSFNSATLQYELIADGGYQAGHRDGMPVGTYSYNISCVDLDSIYEPVNTTDAVTISSYSTSITVENDTGKTTNEQVFFYANYTKNDGYGILGMNNQIGRMIWNTTDLGSVKAIAFVDLDNDGGKDEVVIGEVTAYTSGRVYGYYSNGSQKWSNNLGDYNGWALVELSIGDLDNDGYENEIAVYNTPAYQDTRLKVINETGNLVWATGNIGTSYTNINEIGDLDNDGYKDDIVGARNGLIVVYNGSGTQLWNSTLPTTDGPKEIAIGDIDNDGNKDDVVLANFGGDVFVFNDSGSPIWNKTTFGASAISIGIGDFDLDGNKDDVVVGIENSDVEAYNESGNQIPGWSYDTGDWVDNTNAELIVVDLNNDGYDDVVAGAEQGINGINNSDSQLWKYTLANNEFIYSLSVGDINDDGWKEIVAGSTADTIYILNRTGGLLWKYTLNLGDIGTNSGSSASTDISDINNDGINDIAVASANGFAHIFNDMPDCQIRFNDTSVVYNMSWNQTIKKWQFNRTFTNAGQYEWNATCIKEGYTQQITGDNVTITSSNTAPFIQNISISPTTAYTNSTLNCSANYGDADSDKGNVTINWTNGTTQYGVITILNVIGGQMVSNSTPAGIQVKNEVWNCTINATDSGGLVSALNSTTKTISNTLPEITSAVVLNVTSATILTRQINCSFNHSDADTETLTDNFRWYKNDVFTGNTTSWITNRSFTTNDVLICEGWVSDTTPANSSIINSSSLTIDNSPPNIPILSSPSNNSNISTRNVTLEITTHDADGDAITNYFYIDDVLNKTQSGNSLIINISDGSHNWTAKSGDGIGNSSNASYSVFNISVVTNTAPNVTINFPANASTFSNISVQLNSTVLDADNDNMDVYIYAANNTKWLNTSLVYVNSSVKNAQEIIYNLTALPVQPDNATVLLMHFDNRSEFSENDTNVSDFSSRNHWGNCTAGSNCPTWNKTGGKFAGAFEFSANTQYIGVSYSSDFDFDSGEVYTFASWIKFSTTSWISNWPTVIAKGEGSPNWGANAFYNDIRFYFYWYNGAWRDVIDTSGATWQANTWYHVVTVVNEPNNNISFYRNGVLLSNVSADFDTYPLQYQGSGRVTIGRRSGNNMNYFPGTIDEVAIWNRSLSATEILNLYRLQAQKYYWRVNASDGTTENSSFNYEFTINNSVPTTPEIGGPANASRTIGNSVTLRCANSTDANGDTINYVFYGDTSVNPTTVLQNGTGTTYTWSTTDGSTYYWRCKAEDNQDASAFTAQKTFTENSVPSAINLIYPAHDSSTTNRTPQLNWSASSDSEGDSITYQVNVTCYPSCSGDNRLFNNSASNQNWTNVSSRLLYFWDDLYYYNWTVRAWDGYEFGAWNGTPYTMKLSSLISLSMLNATVNFSNLLIGETANTTTDNPFPLSIQNDGNSFVSINMSNDTALIWSTQQSPSSYYRYKIDNVTGENISFNWSGSITTWTNVPIANNTVITFFNYTDGSDSAEIDVLVTVPPAEPPGAKSSRLVFTGWYVRET